MGLKAFLGGLSTSFGKNVVKYRDAASPRTLHAANVANGITHLVADLECFKSSVKYDVFCCV